ncbi:hypothetical protein Tco_0093484 [Tanacetum coccineum]
MRVYVSQPPGFVDPDHPKKVYKVVKLCMDCIKLLELDIKKFDLVIVKTAINPWRDQSGRLQKDKEAVDVDVHLYRSMIGTDKSDIHINKQSKRASTDTESEESKRCQRIKAKPESQASVPPTPPTTQPIPSEATTIPPLTQPEPPIPIAKTTTASPSPSPSHAHEPMEHTFEQPLIDQTTLHANTKLPTSPVMTRNWIDLENSSRKPNSTMGKHNHLYGPRKDFGGEEQVEDISPTTLEAAAILTKVQKIKSVDKGKRYKRRKSSKEFAVTGLDFEEVKSAFEKVNTGGIRVSVPSPDRGRREGKAPMTEEEETQASRKTKEQILQEEAGLAEAIRLDALEKALEKEEVAKQVHLDSNYSSKRMLKIKEFNRGTKEKGRLNAELKESVLGKNLTVEDYAKRIVELNQRTWKLTQLKKLNFEEVKAKFEILVKQLDTYVPMNFEATKESLKRFGEELQTKTAKKLKFDDEDHNKDESEDSDEANEKDDSTSGRKGVYQIIRENGTDMVYISFGAMLIDISRDDFIELYKIVIKKHGMNEPEDEFEKVTEGVGVHCLNLESSDIYMLTERKYPLTAEVCKAMLDKKLQGGKPDEDCYKLLKWMEKQAGIRK